METDRYRNDELIREIAPSLQFVERPITRIVDNRNSGMTSDTFYKCFVENLLNLSLILAEGGSSSNL